MAALILEIAVRAALMAAGTAVVLWAFRIKTPAVRHAAWTAVLLAMLLLPMWSVTGLKVPLRVLRLVPTASRIADAPSMARPQIAEPIDATAPAPVPPATPARRLDWQNIIMGIYGLGAGALLLRLIIGTVQSNRLRRSAVTEGGHTTHRQCTTPVTVGMLAPVIILPPGWQHWPSGKLHAVLTHESEHVRRHDTLVQWLALFNRAVFWFHPLAWWLERRLATLAEEACDAAVLAAGHSPQDYSAYLLDFARSVIHEGRRVRIVGMAMPGNMLRSRLCKILDGVAIPTVSRARAACTITVCALSSAVLAAATLTSAAPAISAAAQGGTTAQFEVVSIKPCEGLPRALALQRGGLKRIDNSANRLFLECITLESLANLAYTRNGDFILNEHIEDEVRGGPDWIRSERYTIEAKATGNPTAAVMMGPMLRAVLEDRFQLHVHRETGEIPMYGLTVAKGGLKIKPITTGDCLAEDDENTAAAARAMGTPGQKPPCGAMRSTRRGSVKVWDFGGTDLGFLAQAIDADRQILDQTGIKDRFNIHLEYETDERVLDGVNIFAALEQQLGLKLVSTKGPHQFIVIDGVERPKPNGPVPVS